MSEVDMSYGKVEGFFNELLDSKTPRIKKFQIYGMYLNAIEETEKRKVFESAYKRRQAEFYFAHLISDDLAVMEYTSRGKTLYTACLLVDNQPKIIYTYYKTFDEALIAGLCLKYSGNEDATKWVAKLIGLQTNQEN